MKTIRIWPVLAVFALVLPGLAHAETTTFEDPMQGRFRLDYCRYERQDCGIAAAFAWCKQEGYRQIVNYRGERDVANTQHIGDGSTCRANRGETCDGFASITCTRDGPPPALDLDRDTPAYPDRPDFEGGSRADEQGGGD